MNVEKRDYLQVFQLGSAMIDDKRKQTIIHSQKQPEYRKDYAVCAKQIISVKIYVIDDNTRCTVLLAEEFRETLANRFQVYIIPIETLC